MWLENIRSKINWKNKTYVSHKSQLKSQKAAREKMKRLRRKVANLKQLGYSRNQIYS